MTLPKKGGTFRANAANPASTAAGFQPSIPESFPISAIPPTGEPAAVFRAVAASDYTPAQLADIYNQARVDYIVPMPMNARRMEDYVRDYAVDLSASCVLQDEHGEPLGIGMLGLRERRAWITRLGVLPQRRRHHVGQWLMQWLLEQAQEHGAEHVQLEVIEGNDPAIRLFAKLGFLPRRTLLVVRRAPAEPNSLPDGAALRDLTRDEITTALHAHDAEASWIDESASWFAAGDVCGLRLTLPDGAEGDAVYRANAFQITNLILHMPDMSPDVLAILAPALLNAVHGRFPYHDAKVENLPLDSPYWTFYQAVGYRETFRRLEMQLG